MDEAKTHALQPPADMRRVEPEVPIAVALTLQRLSLAETLKAEQAQIEAARLRVRRAFERLGARVAR